MEYIFGVVDRNGVTVENLKTVGETHSDLGGFVQTVREYPDSTITDRFRIIEKYQSDEDAEGNCYDWYYIDSHNCNVDRTPAVKQSDEFNIVHSMYAALGKKWDGIKWVYDPNNPVPLLYFPTMVEPNAFYRAENGKVYIGLASGMVDENNFSEMLEPLELE